MKAMRICSGLEKNTHSFTLASQMKSVRTVNSCYVFLLGGVCGSLALEGGLSNVAGQLFLRSTCGAHHAGFEDGDGRV